MQHYSMPMGLISFQDSAYELTIFQKNGCLFSGTWPLSKGITGGDLVTATAKNKIPDLEENVFFMDNGYLPALPAPSRDMFSGLPSISENPSIAAVAPALSDRQEISIDENPPKLALFHPIRIITPLILLFISVIFFMTWNGNRENRNLQKQLNIAKTEIAQLKNNLKPLEQKRRALRQANMFLEDIDDFMKVKPRLFSHINEIARLIPEDTWFSYFDFKNGIMTLRGEGPDVLKIIEALRSSKILGQVNLKGSVNRSRTGMERFSLSIKTGNNATD